MLSIKLQINENKMTIPAHVFIGLNPHGKMCVLEKFYVGSKIKEAYFDEEQILKIDKFLKEEFPAAFFKKRNWENVVYRQSICYLLDSFKYQIKLKRIGAMFSEQDHSTVIHSRKVVKNWLECDGYEDNLEILQKVQFKVIPFLIMMELEQKNA